MGSIPSTYTSGGYSNQNHNKLMITSKICDESGPHPDFQALDGFIFTFIQLCKNFIYIYECYFNLLRTKKNNLVKTEVRIVKRG